MKILHSADWHLGAYVGPQCDDPMKRMANTMKCLDVLVETARQEQPDIILVSGDIFHTAKVWADRALTEVRIAAKYINLLSQFAPIAVLYGTPNHDGEGQFETLQEMTPGIYYITEPGIKMMLTKSGFIQIAGLPGFDKGHFRAQFPGLSAEEENQVFTQQLAAVVQGLSAQVDSTIPSVLMAHHTVVGCELDNGTHVFQANEVVLDAATLDNSAFDLVCLGHIHKAQRVNACRKPVYYAGSIDSFTFNDEGHEKGFYSHYTNKNSNNEEYGCSYFNRTPAREFLTENWDETCFDLYKTYGFNERARNQYGYKVVRILYTCDSETEKALDKKKLERDLYAAGAYYVSEIRPEKVTALINRNAMTEKMTEKACLERYLLEKMPSDIGAIMFSGLKLIGEAQASSPMGTTSGLFLPVEISVRNYRSYAEETLSFEDIFFAMVNGKNGSGKSSLFMDAITDCLYEETREKELTGWIRNGEKSGSISFTFRLGDDLWRVTRTRQRSGKATLALAKLVPDAMLVKGEFIDGKSWQDHSCERMTDTQQKIVDLLGMDCDTFQSCVLIMQDRYGKFMEASKEDRMAVLANLLGLGMYDELEKLAKEKLTEVNRSIKSIKADIERLESEVRIEEDLRTEAGQIEVSLACANDDLKAAREALAGYQKQLTEIESYTRELTTLEREVKQKTEAYSEKKNKKTDLKNRVMETESFLKNEQIILDKCAELESTRLAIASLEGKVQLLNDKKFRCSKINLEMNQLKLSRESISRQLNLISENLKEKDELEALVRDNDIESLLEECEDKARKYRSLDSKMQVLSQQITSFKNQTEMLKDSQCVDIENASCRFLKSAKEASKLLDSTRIDYDACIKEMDSVLYNREFHNQLLLDVKKYRNAKDRLSKMAADSATADELYKKYSEQGERLNGLEIELKAVADEISQLENETKSFNKLHSRVRELQKYEEQKMHIPKAKQFVESSSEQIEQLAVDMVSMSEEIEKQNNRLAELQGLVADKNNLCEKIKHRSQVTKTYEDTISTLNQQIGTIKAKLEAIFEQKQLLSEKKIDLEKSAKEAAHLQVLSEAFSQDGIPYQIIRDIVPELEAAANEILGQMTGGRMRLEFVTEKVLKSNKAKEIATLEIIIIDVNNGVLPYLSRSGGQKVRAALAVNFALANIKASRVGLQLGMMFVDEPPFLDADGIEAYCAALETIHNKYPEMKLLAISHDENMKSMFPQQLYIDVEENGSKVRRAA